MQPKDSHPISIIWGVNDSAEIKCLRHQTQPKKPCEWHVLKNQQQVQLFLICSIFSGRLSAALWTSQSAGRDVFMLLEEIKAKSTRKLMLTAVYSLFKVAVGLLVTLFYANSSGWVYFGSTTRVSSATNKQINRQHCLTSHDKIQISACSFWFLSTKRGCL